MVSKFHVGRMREKSLLTKRNYRGLIFIGAQVAPGDQPTYAGCLGVVICPTPKNNKKYQKVIHANVCYLWCLGGHLALSLYTILVFCIALSLFRCVFVSHRPFVV